MFSLSLTKCVSTDVLIDYSVLMSPNKDETHIVQGKPTICNPSNLIHQKGCKLLHLVKYDFHLVRSFSQSVSSLIVQGTPRGGDRILCPAQTNWTTNRKNTFHWQLVSSYVCSFPSLSHPIIDTTPGSDLTFSINISNFSNFRIQIFTFHFYFHFTSGKLFWVIWIPATIPLFGPDWSVLAIFESRWIIWIMSEIHAIKITETVYYLGSVFGIGY